MLLKGMCTTHLKMLYVVDILVPGLDLVGASMFVYPLPLRNLLDSLPIIRIYAVVMFSPVPDMSTEYSPNMSVQQKALFLVHRCH